MTQKNRLFIKLWQRFEMKQKHTVSYELLNKARFCSNTNMHKLLSVGIPCKFKNKLWINLSGRSTGPLCSTVCVSENDCKRKNAWVRDQAMVQIDQMMVDGNNLKYGVHANFVLCGNCVFAGTSVINLWEFEFIKGTYEVFLELLHLLLVALQSAVVHGAALDGDLSHLQVHLLKLEPTNNSSQQNISKVFSYTLKYISAASKIYFESKIDTHISPSQIHGKKPCPPNATTLLEILHQIFSQQIETCLMILNMLLLLHTDSAMKDG